MRYGGPVAVVALLALGAGGGYVAEHTLPEPVRAEQQPVPAASPAHPADDGVREDPDIPPLDPEVELTEAALGTGRHRVLVPVPVDWERYVLSDDESRWAVPDNLSGTYSVRVKALQGKVPLRRLLADRKASLPGDGSISDLRIIESDESTALLVASFVHVETGFRKVTVVRWLNFHGGATGNLEIAWTGRERDEDGMRRLLARMADGAHPAPRPPEAGQQRVEDEKPDGQ